MPRRKDSRKWYGNRRAGRPLFTTLASKPRRMGPGYIPPGLGVTCGQRSPEGFACTRAGHQTGSHVAHNTVGDMELQWP